MNRLGPDARKRFIERLAKLLGMLGSAHDGERAAAGLLAHELIRRHGLSWSDLSSARHAHHARAAAQARLAR
jgi:hypothetical protein